jgi:two-component sensor histidine kinase
MYKDISKNNKEIKVEIIRNNELESILKDYEKSREVIRISPIPKFVIDKDHNVIYWNRALEKYTNISAMEIIGTRMHWKAFYETERPCMADFIVDERIEDIHKWYPGKDKRSKFVVRYHGYNSRSSGDACEAIDFFPMMGKEGKWLHFTAEAIRNSKGEIIGAVETLEDISKQIAAQEETQRLKESEAFLREIHYKVKNNIEIISSLLNIQSDYIDQTGNSKEIHNFLNSIALIHEVLYQSDNLLKIKFKDYIEKLTSDISKSYDADSVIEFEINSEDILLDMDTALPCGLIINEIVSDSIKYSFPEGKGKISVNFKSDEDRYMLTLSNNGVGFPEYFESNEKSGLPILDSLINLLNHAEKKIEIEKDSTASFKFTFVDLDIQK